MRLIITFASVAHAMHRHLVWPNVTASHDLLCTLPMLSGSSTHFTALCIYPRLLTAAECCTWT